MAYNDQVVAKETKMEGSLSGVARPRASAESAGASTADLIDSVPAAIQYLLSFVAVALATAVAVGLQGVIEPANLTLIFVLPVMVVAMAFGWGPSMATAVAGALSFDFFLTEPKYSLRIDGPSDIWATVLLLIVGAIVSTLAAQGRRRTREARRAAAEAKALQDLAHAVITTAPRRQIFDIAALTLTTLFDAPALILVDRDGQLEKLAAAGGASMGAIEKEAARLAIEVGAPTHGGAYPTDGARFDFWPVKVGDEVLAVGIDFSRVVDGRPEDPKRYVEVVCGYLAAALVNWSV
jgi:two-component system sensor histidine kinase KdpD